MVLRNFGGNGLYFTTGENHRTTFGKYRKFKRSSLIYTFNLRPGAPEKPPKCVKPLPENAICKFFGLRFMALC